MKNIWYTAKLSWSRPFIVYYSPRILYVSYAPPLRGQSSPLTALRLYDPPGRQLTSQLLYIGSNKLDTKPLNHHKTVHTRYQTDSVHLVQKAGSTTRVALTWKVVSLSLRRRGRPSVPPLAPKTLSALRFPLTGLANPLNSRNHVVDANKARHRESNRYSNSSTRELLRTNWERTLSERKRRYIA